MIYIIIFRTISFQFLKELKCCCRHFDALFDLYDEKSDIARINAAAGEPVRCLLYTSRCV